MGQFILRSSIITSLSFLSASVFAAGTASDIAQPDNKNEADVSYCIPCHTAAMQRALTEEKMETARQKVVDLTGDGKGAPDSGKPDAVKEGG